MKLSFASKPENFKWQHHNISNAVTIGGKGVGAIIVVAFFVWLIFFGGLSFILSFLPHSVQYVKLQLQTNDGIAETVFSPAGASVKVWDRDTGSYLGALSEDTSHDGKWDGAFPVLVGSWVLVKVADSGSTYYTNVFERLVPPGEVGVERIGILDPVDVYPRSATSASDLTGTMMTAGAEVDNSTGIATSETEIEFSLTAASGKAWGGHAYTDPESGDTYIGAFIVFDLTTTTARATITGSNVWNHWSVGSHEYWVFTVPQVINDDDISTDGTYHFTVTFNNLVAAADALDIGAYVNAVDEDVKATSFGTNDAGLAQAEAWIDIHLN